MTSPWVDGAHPRRATSTGSTTSSSTGSSPRLSADAQSRAQQLAAQFTAQIELSMMQSLTQLSEGGEPEETGEESEDGGDGGLGFDSGMQQMLTMTSLFSGASKGGGSAAQLQAQLSSLGLGNLDGTSAGAGSEAQLAQQLLGMLGGATGTGGAGAAWNGLVDAGAPANAKVVADVAKQQGVDPVVAVAMMLVESGGRSNAVGDNGTSFGLFQLHQGGMLTSAGLQPQQAFDPRTNATVALKSLAHEWAKGSERRSPGEIAAASQRPADPVGYAAKVDGAMDRARALLAGRA